MVSPPVYWNRGFLLPKNREGFLLFLITHIKTFITSLSYTLPNNFSSLNRKHILYVILCHKKQSILWVAFCYLCIKYIPK